MIRTDIINFLIYKNNFKNYLEIGVSTGDNISHIITENKDGVDPGVGIYSNLSSLVNFKMTSDEFFSKNEKHYDFIFIDGLHETEQVDKDIFNSLKFLNKDGMIMLHDTLPASFENQEVPRKTRVWNGDVWKSVVKLKYNRPDLEIKTVDTDMGCTIIKFGSQKIIENLDLNTALTWDYFQNNKKTLLNIISVDEFKEEMFNYKLLP